MRKFPIYRQRDSMDCGAACLQMVARYYGRRIPLQLLRVITQIGRDGTSLLGVSEAAEEIGLKASAVQLSVDALIRLRPLPCILYWNQYHFVVLYKAGKNRLLIADPGRGIVYLGIGEFRRHWTTHIEKDGGEGIALVLEPTRKFYEEKNREGKKEGEIKGRNLFGYLTPHRKTVIQLIFGILTASLLQLSLPFLSQSIIDIGIRTADVHFIYLLLLAQLALFVGRLSVDLVRNWLLMYMGARISATVIKEFLVKLMKMPVAFFDSKRTGDILQRMSDHQRIEVFLTGSSINVLFSMVMLVVFSVVLAFFNRGLFVVFGVSSLIYSIWIGLFLEKRKELDYTRFDISAKGQGVAVQMIQGMQEIRLNSMEEAILLSWEQLRERLFRLNLKSLTVNQWQQTGASFISEGKNILVTLLSAKAVVEGKMTLGTMLAVQYIIGQLNSPIEQLVGFVQGWQNARMSADRINEIHSMENEEPEDAGLIEALPVGPGSAVAGEGIRFRDVSFTYPGTSNEPVLREIDLFIPAGKTTAIVGMSGSGKTTLLKLLLRFYEPQKGQIIVNGSALASMSHRIWRSHCGVVMQDSYIFSDSILRNIAVGSERVDEKRLNRAIGMANLGDLIEQLPLGINTLIGMEGKGISVGQRQRILIARAVYRNPEIIFFDEATNSLDANNESIILRNLNSFFAGRTVVIVAHRLSTVRHADQIIVLNQGRVSERGTHRELIGKRTEYYDLVGKQMELGE